MTQLHSLISTVIASAMDRAARGAGEGDLVHGVLAGLKRLRAIVGSQAGYSAACGLDDSVHDIFLQRSLESFGSGAVAVPLPPRGPNAIRACAILEDVAMSCLTLNAFFKGNTALDLGVQVLTERLIECAGGVPDWGAVIDELRSQDVDAEETANEDGWISAAVH